MAKIVPHQKSIRARKLQLPRLRQRGRGGRSRVAEPAPPSVAEEQNYIARIRHLKDVEPSVRTIRRRSHKTRNHQEKLNPSSDERKGELVILQEQDNLFLPLLSVAAMQTGCSSEYFQRFLVLKLACTYVDYMYM